MVDPALALARRRLLTSDEVTMTPGDAAELPTLPRARPRRRCQAGPLPQHGTPSLRNFAPTAARCATPDAGQTLAAHAHYRWLADIAPAGIELPPLVHAGSHELVFGRIDGVTPTTGHLPDLATVLGQLHHAATAALVRRPARPALPRG